MVKKRAIQGVSYLAGSSRRIEAMLLVEEGRLRLIGSQGEELGAYDPGAFSISDPAGNLPYRFDFCDGAAFETSDHGQVEHCFHHHISTHRKWLHRLEQSWRWVLLAVVLLPLITLGLLRYGLPGLAIPLAKTIPQDVLYQLDLKVMESIDEEGWMKPSKASPTENKRMRDAWKSFETYPDLTLQQRDGGLFGANAFALPGGTIVVTDQLLEVLESRQQLVAVLAHEIGHIKRQHGVRNVIQGLGVAVIFATIVGDVSWLAESILVTAPTLLQQMSYSRDFEREADRFAMEQLRALNIPGSCLGESLNNIVNFHRLNSEKKGQPNPKDDSRERNSVRDETAVPRWFDYLSTHPRTEERVELAGAGRCD